MPYDIVQVGEKYSIPKVPIMAIFKDGEVNYDEAKLKRIASNFANRKAKSIEANCSGQGSPLLPKLYKGHAAQNKERESYGMIDNVVYENGILYGDYVGLDINMAQELADNKYPNRSTEVTKSSEILQGLALLGASQPRIPLPDMVFNALNDEEIIIVDESGKMQDYSRDFAFLDKLIQNKVDEKVDILLKSDIMSPKIKKEDSMAEDTKPDTTVELNALKEKLEALEKSNKAFQDLTEKQGATIANMEKQAARTADEILLNSLANEGFMLGGSEEKENYLSILSTMDKSGKDKFVGTLRKTLKQLNMEQNSAGDVIPSKTPAVKEDEEYGVVDKFSLEFAKGLSKE